MLASPRRGRGGDRGSLKRTRRLPTTSLSAQSLLAIILQADAPQRPLAVVGKRPSAMMGPFVFDGAADASVEWRALDLKEEAQELWALGCLEQALPLAQESARLREGSSRICLSLSELGGIYLDMLKIDDAEETARRMLREAHRYDTQAQTRIARQLLEDAKKERAHGFHYGNAVSLHGLNKIEMNGQLGEIRGRVWPQTAANSDRYRVLVGSSMLSIRRRNINLVTVVVQLTFDALRDGSLIVTGKALQGDARAWINVLPIGLKAAAVRLKVAESMGQPPSAVQLVLPGGHCVRDNVAGDAALQTYADLAVGDAVDAAIERYLDNVHEEDIGKGRTAPDGKDVDEEVEEMHAADKLRDPLRGARIRRTIDGQAHAGRVEDIQVGKLSGERLYLIKYDDGDLEHLTADRVEQWKITTTGERLSAEICKRCGASSLETEGRLHRCPGCLKTFYCSDICRRSDRKSHKRACKRAAKNAAAHGA